MPNSDNLDNEEAEKLLVKKRKINPNDECFESLLLLESDLSCITDYFILLFSQVKRGVMNEYDLEKAKKRRACDHIGFLGLRCRHCGGVERGKYFPSCAKNLQATPPTLHAHLLLCGACPEEIKRALKLTKTRHKFSAPVSRSCLISFHRLLKYSQYVSLRQNRPDPRLRSLTTCGSVSKAFRSRELIALVWPRSKQRLTSSLSKASRNPK